MRVLDTRMLGSVTRTLVLDGNVVDELQVCARRDDVGAPIVLLAALTALLSRYTGQDDIAIGWLTGGTRPDRGTGGMAGASGLVAVRSTVAGDPSFSALLHQMRASALAAVDGEVDPRRAALSRTGAERVAEAGRRPDDAIFVLHHVRPASIQDGMPPTLGRTEGQVRAEGQVRLGDLRLELPFERHREGHAYDLALQVTTAAEGLAATFQYNTDLFAARTVDLLAGHLQTLLHGALANPDQRLSTLPLLTHAERERLLVEGSGAPLPYPADRCIHHVIEERVARTPDAIAVECGEERLTYRELDRQANRLAHYLQKAGVGPETCAGLYLEQSPRLFVALLGILKAGGGFVPLDPIFPIERLSFMLADAEAPVLITQRRLLDRLPVYAGRVICLDKEEASIAAEPAEAPASAVTRDNLACIIYTSGSTGLPKGVVRTHASLTNAAVHHQLHVTEGMRWLHCFDITLQGIFPLWCAGGALVFSRDDLRRDPVSLLRFVAMARIDTAFLPPAFIQQLADTVARDGIVPVTVREVMTAGEQLHITPEMVDLFTQIPGSRLVNVYGAIESHTASMYFMQGPPALWPAHPPIGRAAPNRQVYLLDEQRQPVPAGVVGEVYVGGPGLARGYHNRPDLTAERFVAHPFDDTPGARLYRTGDLARYRHDGLIEAVGRRDDQVKLRGLRIELGEVKAVLRMHPAVAAATVVVREDTPGNRRLVAYLVPRPGHTPRHSDVRAFVATRLPDYMIPAAYVTLDALPLTPTNKVDRRALPAPIPDRSSSGVRASYVASRDEMEQAMVRLWEQALDVRPIGVTDNFFDLGGHSLHAARLFARIKEEFGVALPVGKLLEGGTIAHVVGLLRQPEPRGRLSEAIAHQTRGARPPLFCVTHPGGSAFVFRHLARHLAPDQPVYGLEERPDTGVQVTIEQQYAELLEDLLRHVRALQPSGPYFLMGYSMGGVTALEMARRLLAQGEQVALLVLLDTPLFTSAHAERLAGWPQVATTVRLRAIHTLLKLRWHAAAWLDLDPEARLAYATRRGQGLYRKMAARTQSDRRRMVDRAAPHGQEAPEEWSPWWPYTPATYPGRIHLFWSAGDALGYLGRPDPRLNWRAIAAGGLEIKRFPYRHCQFLNESPIIERVGREIQACLNRARREAARAQERAQAPRNRSLLD